MGFIQCRKSSGWKRSTLFFSLEKFIPLILIAATLFLSAPFSSVQAQEKPSSGESEVSSAVPNYFAQQFYMRPDQKALFKAVEVDGIIFVPTPNRRRNAQYSMVTDFENAAMRSRYVPGPKNLEELRRWVKTSFKKADYQGVEIKQLDMPDGSAALHIVGHKAFPSSSQAQESIEQSRAVIEAQGADFQGMVDEAKKLFLEPPPEELSPKSRAQFEKEEDLVLRYLDHMDIGNEIYGPINGTSLGEKVIWQSFSETTWRNTNLESEKYMQQVGFWTNRIVMKGIKAPFNTIDPYVEATIAMDSSGVDFKNNAIFSAGLEWRVFARNAWLVNTRFWSLPLLSFVRNYRFYIEYQDRKNIADEIIGGKGHDWKGGAGIFYEWGIDPPPVSEGAPSTIPDYIRRYVWGEYFGNYYFAHTNFNAEDDVNTFIFNSSIILGIRLPGIPLPANPILDEFMLMPYMRFEHVNNSEFSAPFENRYFVAAGFRWMPFNNYRYKDNEWLAKTKIFFEYIGVGKVHTWKNPDEVTPIDYDLRVGINISSKRI